MGAVRGEVEARVIGQLEALGAPFEIIPIDPAYADTAAFCERYGFPPDHAGNTIICASKGEPRRYAAGLVQATRRLDVNHTVRRLMGVFRVSFAGADEVMALTGMMIGGVTVFGLPAEVCVYVDEPLLGLDYIILGSGSRSSKIKIAPQALLRLPGASVVPGLGLEAKR